jgi:hypothetical protein
MNYEKVHNLIIDRARNRVLEGYGEVHHIIPKCMGGDDSEDNLVKLTAKEHFIIHKLLVEIYPTNNKLHYAAFLMCKLKKGYRVGAREYQRYKENITLDREHRGNISKSMMGNKNNLGRVQSDDTKSKISNSMTGKVRTKQHRLNQSRSIVQYDLSDNFIREYKSIREAGEINNLFPANISAVLRGKSSHCGGYHWRYKD